MQNFGVGVANPFYPRAWQASNGNVITAATNGSPNIYAIDPTGNGSVSVVGQTPVNLSFNEPAIMFAQDRCLILASNGSCWIMNISGSTPVFTQTGGLAPDRVWSNLTVLPDGRVMVSGGSQVDNQLTGVNNTVAIWDPSTGVWTSTGANAAVARLYHSTAVLLPDATILSLGGGAPGPLNNLNGEIYTPGYLFDASGAPAVRPVIQQAPPDLSPGQTFTVRVDNPANIRTLALMPFGSTTHSFNTTARRIELSFSVQADGSLRVTLPTNSNVVPPGDWMLFAIGNNGTPSIASTILVHPAVDIIAPSVTINQAAGQADPTSASPINFTVTFSETATGFTASDISFAGSTVGGTLSAVVTGSGPTYNVAVSGMTGTGTVVVSVPAGAATDAAGNASLASTSTDNSVAFDTTPPTVSSVVASGAGITNGNGNLNAGKVVTLTVAFSEAVTVNTSGGAPTLALNDGGAATYTDGSGSNSLFTASATPAETSPTEGQQVEVGVKFQSSVAGQITALKFYRSPSDTSSDLLDLWSSTGVNLASVPFTNTTASGWQTVSLATPVTISANTTYVVSYHTSGFFVKTANFFTTAFTSGVLTAPSSTTAGGNGVFADAGTSTAAIFPTNTYLDANYWADVVFQPTSASSLNFSYTVAAGQTTSDLTVTAFNLNGATVRDAAGNNANLAGAVTNPPGILTIDTVAPGVPTITQVTDDVLPVTGVVANGGSTDDTTPTVRIGLSGTNAAAGDQAQLFNGTSALGSAIVLTSGNISNGFVDVTTAALAQGTYNFNAKITDVAGNTSGASSNYTVTINSGAAPSSLFTASATPAETSPTEGQQVEVGVKFQSSVAGQITALKFYRSPSDTSSDLLDLWSSTGVNLASVPFTNTTASGWQTVSLATPVTISANTTYVVSYHTSGFFVKTANFFTTAFTSGVLTAPSSTTAGGNGVFADAGTSTAAIFPTNTYLDANYWADVVFQPTSGTPPTVSSVAASGAGITNGNGNLNAGKVVTLTVAFSNAVTVNTSGGTPTLALNDGGAATYTGGSGSNSLIFSYTVAAGQNTSDLTVTAFNLNGATSGTQQGTTPTSPARLPIPPAH